MNEYRFIFVKENNILGVMLTCVFRPQIKKLKMELKWGNMVFFS